jgi:hypothetical protein
MIILKDFVVLFTVHRLRQRWGAVEGNQCAEDPFAGVYVSLVCHHRLQCLLDESQEGLKALGGKL